MDESTKKLLAESYAIVRENNTLLKKIDRRQRWSSYWRIFMMLLAVASALGVYYYLQPYLDQAINFYNEVEKNGSSLVPCRVKLRVLLRPKNS
jgi:hypothetical protein